MTKPKTSIEKLEGRNEEVTDFKSALLACRWKWREVRQLTAELFDLMNYHCGFCKLGTCNVDCPPLVRAHCRELQATSSNFYAGIDEMIDKTMTFLNGLKEPEVSD